MCTGSSLKPTKHPVYLRKKTKSTSVKAKVVKASNGSPLVVRAESTDSGSERPPEYEYVIHGKSSRNHHKHKHVECACGGRCGAKSHGSNKANIIVRGDSKKRCSCNGSGSDGWLCDPCRAAQKKKGVWKLFPCTSESGSCCCGGCESSSGNTSQARFEKNVDTWMKESKEKMKKKRNAKLVCNCHRPGCKVCVIVQY